MEFVALEVELKCLGDGLWPLLKLERWARVRISSWWGKFAISHYRNCEIKFRAHPKQIEWNYAQKLNILLYVV
jgi:hypothetical protein